MSQNKQQVAKSGEQIHHKNDFHHEEQEEAHGKGFLGRAFSYMRHKIQERAAPEIPKEDKILNEQLRARIVQTPEYQSQINREVDSMRIEREQMYQLQKQAVAHVKEAAGVSAEQMKEKVVYLGDKAIEQTKEVLKSTQEALGQTPSSSDSLLEQAKTTASLTYDIAKDKAAPMIEKAQPAIEQAKEAVAPALSKAKDLAVAGYEAASDQLDQYAKDNKDSKLVQLAVSAKEKSSELLEQGKEVVSKAVESEESRNDLKDKMQEKARELKDKGKETLEKAGISNKEELKDKASQAKELVKDKAQDVKEGVQNLYYNYEDVPEMKRKYKDSGIIMANKAFLQPDDDQIPYSDEPVMKKKYQDSGIIMANKGFVHSDSKADKAKEVYEQGKDKVKDVYEQGKDKAKELADKGKEAVKSIAEKGREEARDMALEEKRKEMKQEAGESLSEKVKDKAHEAIEKARDIGQRVKDKASDVTDKGEKIKEKGGQALEKVKEKTQEVKDKAKDISQKAKQDQSQGYHAETSQEFGDDQTGKASEIAAQAYDKTKELGSNALESVKQIANHPIESAEQGYESVKQKVKDTANAAQTKSKEGDQSVKENKLQKSEQKKQPFKVSEDAAQFQVYTKRDEHTAEREADRLLEDAISKLRPDQQDRYKRALYLAKMMHIYDETQESKGKDHSGAAHLEEGHQKTLTERASELELADEDMDESMKIRIHSEKKGEMNLNPYQRGTIEKGQLSSHNAETFKGTHN